MIMNSRLQQTSPSHYLNRFGKKSSVFGVDVLQSDHAAISPIARDVRCCEDREIDFRGHYEGICIKLCSDETYFHLLLAT